MSIHTDHTIDEFTPSTGTLTVDGKQIINDNVVGSDNHYIHTKLPIFAFGEGGVNDEYLVLAKRYVSGAPILASGAMGRIIGARGSEEAGNSPGVQEIGVQSAYTSNDIFRLSFHGSISNTFFTHIDIITIDSVEYYAARARTSGGSCTNGLFFEGMLFDYTVSGKIFTRVRASDANVTVVTTGVATCNTWTFGTAGLQAVIDGSVKMTLDASGSLKINAGNLGYGTGSGGSVTQATSRTTGVTLNKSNGAITLVSAAGSTSWQSFIVTNSAVAATDTVVVNQKSGTDKYMIHVTNVGAGSFEITFATTGGTTTEQPVFNFSVITAVTA